MRAKKIKMKLFLTKVAKRELKNDLAEMLPALMNAVDL